MKHYPSDAEWIESRVKSLPKPWADALRDDWHKTNQVDHYAANVDLRNTTEALLNVSVPLDASDSDVCHTAEKAARLCFARFQMASVTRRQYVITQGELRTSMAGLCSRMGIHPPKAKFADSAAIARMIDAHWWRKQLRKVHGRALEGAAIQLGYVNRDRGCYCSDQALRRRRQQRKRNLDTLENTIAINELSDEFTLAQLSARSISNAANKRAELMTRISGFEHVAVEAGHKGIFLTITCPSKYHRWRTVGGSKATRNPRYDPSLKPDVSNRYLGKVWSRIRAALKRKGIEVYGVRVSEPQHDGTPHWHFLIFMPLGQLKPFKEIVRHYALDDSPYEPGANLHRVDFKYIDATKGTAAGYIAKYISKNIDGHGVDKDLYGNDAKISAERVDAWASTWGIRQFQHFGGPPVGPWRELRRVAAIENDAPDHLHEAHKAVNKNTQIDGHAEPCASWKRYIYAQGGTRCGRDYRIRVRQEVQDGKNKYGEDLGTKPVGVETWSIERNLPLSETASSTARHSKHARYWFAPSVRHVWTISAKRQAPLGSGFFWRSEASTLD